MTCQEYCMGVSASFCLFACFNFTFSNSNLRLFVSNELDFWYIVAGGADKYIL